MHSLLSEHLEEYLSGDLGRTARQALEQHLTACAECRRAWELFRASAEELHTLRPPQNIDVEPAPGFYARVMEQIEQEREVPFWSMLLDPGFGRRVVFACLMLLALLGAYVAAVDQGDYTIKHRPEAILAGTTPQGSPLGTAPRFGSNLEQNRGAVLATLVTEGD